MPPNKGPRKRRPVATARRHSDDGRSGRPAGARAETRADDQNRRPASGRGRRRSGGGGLWIYGRHAGLAALANPAREVTAIRVADTFLENNAAALADRAAGRNCEIERVSAQSLDRQLGAGAVHQGLAVAARPLDQPDVVELRPPGDDAVVVVLDQASDPRNVGAAIRAAAAFGALAVVTTERGAPPETGALAKAAVGCLETMPYVRATNLARALDALKENGFWTLGLDGVADAPLAEAAFDRPTAIVMGAEDKGLRRLTAAACDALVRIPMAPGVESLNLATATAIALYEMRRLGPLAR